MVRKKAAVCGEERCVTTLKTAAKETNERMDNEKSYYGKAYVVRSTTDINLFIIQSDNKSFHNPKLLDVSYPGPSIWF